MAKDLNKVQLTGRLGKDPEMRYTSQGSAVTTFSVASGRTWKDKDGNQHEDTEWFRVVAWDKLGEICNQYLTKGTHVYVEGRLQTRKWQDRDGNDRYTTEVIAQDMIILSSRNSGERPSAVESEEEFEEQPEAAAPAAPRRAAPAPAPAAPARGSASNGGAAARAAGRTPTRNQPQPIESDDDIPF